MADLRKSPYIGVGLDESTDRASEKHVVFVVRYLAKETVKTTYLQIQLVHDGKAATIYEALKTVLAEYKIPITKVTRN